MSNRRISACGSALSFCDFVFFVSFAFESVGAVFWSYDSHPIHNFHHCLRVIWLLVFAVSVVLVAFQVHVVIESFYLDLSLLKVHSMPFYFRIRQGFVLIYRVTSHQMASCILFIQIFFVLRRPFHNICCTLRFNSNSCDFVAFFSENACDMFWNDDLNAFLFCDCHLPQPEARHR